ncbi:hypothetical protein A2U01_0039295, partial [Trifolium medium]|nr:hypothetical protein [Trifolium medium]
MREKEEREGEGGARSFHGPGPSKSRSGYVHNIDKVATSFYVTNFPDKLNMGGVVSCEEKGSSFREALIGSKSGVAGVVPEEPVLQVEVDKLVLEEFQHSFVGVLALEVE